MDGEGMDGSEREAYASTFDDGSVEIVLGAGIASFGLGMLLSSSALYVVPALLPLVWRSLRRMTASRMDPQRLSAGRRLAEGRRMLIAAAAMAVAGLVGLGVFLLAGRADEGSGTAVMTSVGIAFTSLPPALAAMTGVRRFTLEALACAGVSTACALAGIPPSLYMVAAGGIMAVAGAFILSRFLSRNPRREEPGGAGRP